MARKTKKKTGDCFEASFIFLMNGRTKIVNGKGRDSWRLVHGEVSGQGPLTGVRFGHAWLESDDGLLVADVSNGTTRFMLRGLYYAIGEVGENVYRYTWEETRLRALETKHYGPWDLVTSSGL